MYVCIYVYIYIYMHTEMTKICRYIYIYIHTRNTRDGRLFQSHKCFRQILVISLRDTSSCPSVCMYVCIYVNIYMHTEMTKICRNIYIRNTRDGRLFQSHKSFRQILVISLRDTSTKPVDTIYCLYM